MAEVGSKVHRKGSPPVTAEMAEQIRFLKREKRLYNHQIAAMLNINQGRVSEVLSGKLHPELKPRQRKFEF
jgi:transcriptional regulator with XRE-family HTH domain